MSYTASYIVNSNSAQGTTDFQFTFPYIKEEHIEVFLNFSKITQGSGSAQYQVITNVSPKLIRLNTGIASANLRVEVRRNSSLGTPLVDYADGSTLTANDLDTSALQSLYIDQELKDNQGKTVSVDEATGLPSMGESSAGNLRLTKVADPTSAQDAATKNYIDTFTGNIDGRDLSVDGAKLDGIEANATADQTNAEIRAAVEAASDSNVFTDADHSKLNAIEASATADQTDAEIRTAVENATDSNVFTDADHTKLNAIEASATADQTDAEIRAAVEAASDSNVFTDADHTKLNGIEASATADQTAAEIKTAYESNAQTNPLTDAEKAVIDGVTSNTSELNKLDGYTGSTNDLNIVSGKSFKTSSGTLDTTSDTEIPSSKVIAAHVASSQTAIGGFVTIADEVSFPNTQPATGVVISINNAAGVVINGSGVSTTGRRLDSTTVTINGFPSSLNGETLAAGVGLVVTSTNTANTYAYHKLLAAETDVKQLSDDINDFNARYRVASSAPGSSNDAGDMYFDTSANKMKVYNGTTNAWDDVASVGSFYVNTISSSSGTGGGSATFNGSAYRFTLSNAGTSAQQHIVSVNGVIQKPNSGNSQPSEGFALSGNDIIFSAAPASGSDSFIITCGSSVSIGTPSANSVNSSHIIDGSIVDGDISNSANIAGSKVADDSIPEVKLDIHNAPSGTDKFLKYTSNGMEWVVPPVTDISGKANLSGATFTGAITVSSDSDQLLNLNSTDSNGVYLAYKRGGSRKSYIGYGGSSDSLYWANEISDGDLYLSVNDGGSTLNPFKIDASEGGTVELSVSGTKRFETTSSGINVTGQINVNGSALSTAPTITGTASGAIAANKPCIVHTDGTFKQVVATITPQTPAGVGATGLSAIDGQSINTSTAGNGMAIAHDPVNDNFGFLWCQSNNVYFRLGRRTTSGVVDLTISDTGGVLLVQTGHSPTMCFDSTKEQFVVFNTLQTDSTQVAKGYGYTNSNKNVIEQKWSLTIDSNQCQNPHLIFHPGINKPILVFRAYPDSKAYATIITIASDGASATNTSSLELSGDTSDNEVYMRSVAGLLYDPDRTDKLYIATKMDHTDATKVVTLTVASTSLARAGDDQVVAGGTSNRIAGTQAGFVHDTNTGKDILIYKKNTDSFIYARVVTTSDTGVSVSSETALTSGTDTAHGTTAVYDETLEKIIVIFSDKNDSYKAKAFAVDTSGTNPSAGTISGALTNGNTNTIGTNNFVSDAVYDSKTKNVVWVGVDSGNNSWPRWWNLKSVVQTTNMTTTNFIGFADAAYSNSATATVNVVGNTTTQSSLTAGQKYFVTATGALSTAADIPSVEAGIALSSTKLLIKG